MTAVDRSVIPCTLLTLLLLAGCGGHRAWQGCAVPAAEPATSSKAAVAWSQGPLASTRVAPGELVGLVVDAESGVPVALAQVIVGQWTPGKPPVLTDSVGRFRMPLPNAGETLRVMRIGYDSYATTVPRGDSGLAAVVALRPTAVVLCHVILTHVRDSTFRDSVAVLPDTTDRIVANAALDRQGVYDVVVRSPGYRDWSGSSATRPTRGCSGEFTPAVFNAWLIPR